MAKLKIGDIVKVPTGTYRARKLRKPAPDGATHELDPVLAEGNVVHISEPVAWEGNEHEHHTAGRHITVQPPTGAPISVIEHEVIA